LQTHKKFYTKIVACTFERLRKPTRLLKSEKQEILYQGFCMNLLDGSKNTEGVAWTSEKLENASGSFTDLFKSAHNILLEIRRIHFWKPRLKKQTWVENVSPLWRASDKAVTSLYSLIAIWAC
jgi:hypothetical protein